jgi:tyrosinase
MKRREFLESGATLALGAMTFGTIEIIQAQPGPSVRKSINGLTSADSMVKDYSKAVDAMKKLPQSDPRNWIQQANIHNNFCPHDNWWFLPWHRAYLFYFENICRDVLHDSSFALPYWDWTRLPQIPGPFLDTQSPLWDNGRENNGNIQLGPEIVGPNVISGLVGSGALVDLFSSPTTNDDQRQHMLTGTLESTPHNGVHASILGDMGTYLSPLDPIFWLHHCNVDRIWASWAKQNNNLAPTANLWKNHPLQLFYDPTNKQQGSPNAGDTLDATKYRAIYDTYETRSTRPFVPSEESLLSTMITSRGVVTNAAGVRRVEINHLAGREIALGVPQQFALAVSQDFIGLLQRVVTPQPGAAAVQTAITYLLVENVPRPSVPNTALRIFLNCKNPSVETPLDDPTYVGTVAFFGGTHGPEGHSDTTFTVNVTTALSKVVEAGIYRAGKPIDVAILPVDLSNPKRTAPREILKPGSIRLVGLETM